MLLTKYFHNISKVSAAFDFLVVANALHDNGASPRDVVKIFTEKNEITSALQCRIETDLYQNGESFPVSIISPLSPPAPPSEYLGLTYTAKVLGLVKMVPSDNYSLEGGEFAVNPRKYDVVGQPYYDKLPFNPVTFIVDKRTSACIAVKGRVKDIMAKLGKTESLSERPAYKYRGKEPSVVTGGSGTGSLLEARL